MVVSVAAAGIWLKGLGRRRLKDGGRAEQIFQLQAEGLPLSLIHI